jgi:transcriptional regulator with XRE-family HTH domain
MTKSDSKRRDGSDSEVKSARRETAIGSFIRKNRKARSLTQRQLAEFAGVSFTFLNRLENGDLDVKVSKVNKVLAVFSQQVGPVPFSENEDTQTVQLQQNR